VSRLQRRRRGGFTLVELMLYVGLATVGLLFLGSLELAAHRSVMVQQALIDIQIQADGFLGQLRRDVEMARAVAHSGEGEDVTLEVVRVDGTTVRYRAGERVEVGPDGETHAEAYRLVRELRVEVSEGAWPPRVEATAVLLQETSAGEIRRERRRTAIVRRGRLP